MQITNAETFRRTFIPNEIQCFWCNGRMNRSSTLSGELSYVTYFCVHCGAVSHFAVHDKKRISNIEIKYESQSCTE